MSIGDWLATSTLWRLIGSERGNLLLLPVCASSCSSQFLAPDEFDSTGRCRYRCYLTTGNLVIKFLEEIPCKVVLLFVEYPLRIQCGAVLLGFPRCYALLGTRFHHRLGLPWPARPRGFSSMFTIPVTGDFPAASGGFARSGR